MDLKSEEFQQLSMKEKVAIWRDLGSRNELSAEDMIEGIKYLRQEREMIPKKVTKKSADIEKGNELVESLKELTGL